MRTRSWAVQVLAAPVLATTILAAASGTLAQPGPVPAVPLDGERTIDGVGCTGIGQSKTEPRWSAYSVRVEFSNPAREYLANGAVEVFDRSGHSLTAMRCEGPWILLRLPPGTYKV